MIPATELSGKPLAVPNVAKAVAIDGSIMLAG